MVEAARRAAALKRDLALKDAASVGFYTSVAGKKFARVQLLTIDGLLNETQRAEHPDYEPDLNFKKAKADPIQSSRR